MARLLGNVPSGEQMHMVEMTTLLLLLPFRDPVLCVGTEEAVDACVGGQINPTAPIQVPESSGSSWCL